MQSCCHLYPSNRFEQVHFHIVPASFQSSSSSSGARKPSQNPMALMGIGHGRDELDEDEAKELVQRIKAAVAELAAPAAHL